MSIEKTAPAKSYSRLAAKEFKPQTAEKGKVPEVEKFDVSALQLDDSFGADCDPYNSTGQHLVSALKRKYGE